MKKQIYLCRINITKYKSHLILQLLDLDIKMIENQEENIFKTSCFLSRLKMWYQFHTEKLFH